MDPSTTDTVPYNIMLGDSSSVLDACIDISDDEDLDGEPLGLEDF